MNSRFLLFGFVAILVGLAVNTTTQAQNTYPRLTIIEEFTSATCGPCVAASTAMKDVVKLSKGIVSVRFHMNWPAPGDPWNVENSTDHMGRRTYYGVSGIPYARMNGVETSPTSSSGMLVKAQADNAKGSPVKIDVSEVKNGNVYTVTVKVTSNISLSGHKLHVAVVSKFAPYPGLSSSLPGSNGEEEFYDAMNKMLPNYNGTSLNIAAGADETFTFTYNKGTGNTWPANQQYVVAYIQNEVDKSVLNAGTNLNVVHANVEMVSPTWEPIDRGASGAKRVKISNPTNSELVCTLEISNAASLAQSGWNATLSSSEAVIPAKGSVEVTINSTAVNRAFFAPIELVATPVVSSGISEATAVTCGYLTNNSRIGVYYGLSNYANGAAIPVFASKYGNDAAYLPFSTDVLAAFPPEASFDVAVLPTGYDGRFSIINVTPIAQAMLNAGKGVWISSPVGVAVAVNPNNQQYQGYPACKAFFESFGIGLGSTTARNDGQRYTQFNMTGIPNDAVAGGWTGKGNDGNPNTWPVYMANQDILTLQSNRCKAFIYAESNTSNIVGVRFDEGNTRFVFTSFGAEHVGVEAARNAITEKILTYLLPTTTANKPVISVSTQTLTFGGVMVGNHVDKVLTVTNTGNADLELTEVVLGGSDGTAFDIVGGYIEAGKKVTVAPNGTYPITVRFEPMTPKSSYSGTLTFKSNTTNPNVQLTGSGLASSVETDAVSETGSISMHLVGSNPVTERSAIELRSTANVNVMVVDASGRTVANLYNGVPNGSTMVNINSTTLPSGTYNVVATNGSEHATITIVVTR
jgi:hypothetical protein